MSTTPKKTTVTTLSELEAELGRINATMNTLIPRRDEVLVAIKQEKYRLAMVNTKTGKQKKLTPATKIKSLPLPPEIINALQKESILTIGDLKNFSERDLRWTPGFGQKRIKELTVFLSAGGITLRKN